MNPHHHTILAIDDDIDDLTMLNEALKAVSPEAVLLTAPNGAEGLGKLQKLKESDSLPCLIVLDVNMPVMSGRETLVVLQNDGVLQKVPLVVFSTSISPVDITHFQNKGVEYIVKPVQYDKLLQVVRHLLAYCKK